MGKFQSSKVFDGFSTVFRQWKAKETHCRFIHGYGISFKVYFEGELDERNWVWDLGDKPSILLTARFIPPKSQTQLRSSNSPSKYTLNEIP
jgi:hypothetical protein